MITNINNGYYVHWLLSAMAKRPTMALDPSFRRWIDVTIIISMHSRFFANFNPSRMSTSMRAREWIAHRIKVKMHYRC